MFYIPSNIILLQYMCSPCDIENPLYLRMDDPAETAYSESTHSMAYRWWINANHVKDATQDFQNTGLLIYRYASKRHFSIAYTRSYASSSLDVGQTPNSCAVEVGTKPPGRSIRPSQSLSQKFINVRTWFLRIFYTFIIQFSTRVLALLNEVRIEDLRTQQIQFQRL